MHTRPALRTVGDDTLELGGAPTLADAVREHPAAGAGDLDPVTLRGYSFARACRLALARGTGRAPAALAPFEAEVDAFLRDAGEDARSESSVLVPTWALRQMDTTNSAGLAVEQQVDPGIDLRRALTHASALGLSGAQVWDNVRHGALTWGTPGRVAVGVVAEDDDAPAQEIPAAAQRVEPYSLGIYVEATRGLMKQSDPTLGEWLRAAVEPLFAEYVDTYALLGESTAGIEGVWSSALTVTTAGEPNLEQLAEIEKTALEQGGITARPPGWVLSPTAWEAAQKLAGIRIGTGPGGPRLFDYRTIVRGGLGTDPGRVLFGRWGYEAIVLFGSLEIDVIKPAGAKDRTSFTFWQDFDHATTQVAIARADAP